MEPRSGLGVDAVEKIGEQGGAVGLVVVGGVVALAVQDGDELGAGGGKGVAELVGMHVADPGALGDCGDVAVDGAAVEGLSVVSFDEPPGTGWWPGAVPVGDELDEFGEQGDAAVVVELADGMRSQWVPPLSIMAPASSEASSPARMPVRASSSTMRRRRWFGSTARAAMNLAAVGSSRNFGSASSGLGRSPS